MHTWREPTQLTGGTLRDPIAGYTCPECYTVQFGVLYRTNGRWVGKSLVYNNPQCEFEAICEACCRKRGLLW